MAGLFGGGKDKETPKPEPASRMPDPEDPRVREAERRRIEEMRTRGGRLSTILSDTLGGTIGKRKPPRRMTIAGNPTGAG